MGPILFIHAAEVSLAATESALLDYPGLPVRHALGDGLVDPRAARYELGEPDYLRLRGFTKAKLGRAQRVILSCSVYNGFAERLAAEIGLPVERSDHAGANAALACGTRIGLAVSYPPSYDIIAGHLRACAQTSGKSADVVPLLEGNAFAGASDAATYGGVLTSGAARAGTLDCIFLSQYSMDPQAEAVRRISAVPVVSALTSTLERLFRSG